MVAHIAKQILGAAVAALAGWFAAILFYEVVAIVELLQQPHYIAPGGLVVGAIVATWVMGYFIIPIWLLVLIPLYLFIPSSSPLWRWPLCAACGSGAGLLVIGYFIRGVPGVGGVSSEAWLEYTMAAIAGGVTCLTGSLTKRRFKPSNQSLQLTASRHTV